MKSINKRLVSAAMILCVILAIFAPVSCGGKADETTAPVTTVVPETTLTPETTSEATEAETTPVPETTPEATEPETTVAPEITEAPEPDPGEVFNISYDLDGGIDGGNPTVYNNASDLKLIVPIRPGYDFVGWTGTGIDTPVVSLTIERGTEGDLTLKANWAENTEFDVKIDKTSDDILAKAYFSKIKSAIIIGNTTNDYNEQAARDLQSFFEDNDSIVKILKEDIAVNSNVNYGIRFYFGKSGFEPIAGFASELGYNEYGVLATADSLCFSCWDQLTYDAACAIYYEVLDHVFKGGSFLDFEGGRYVGAIEDHIGTKIPVFENFDSVTDVGEGAIQIYALDSTLEEYNNYCQALADAGFILYTTNTMNKTQVSTYYNDETVVSVLFAGGDPDGELGLTADRALRIVAEPLSNTALPSLEKPEDADATVTPVSITMLDSANDRLGELTPRDGKLCLIIQLSNGHYIIVDSNQNTGKVSTSKMIANYLRDHAPDKNNVVVEAWIFTHFHQDHIGGFIDFCNVSNYLRYVTIKSVIYNFPNERVIQTAAHSPVDMNNIRLFYSTLKDRLLEGGTTFYQARTGQKYYFGNAEIEMLWTFEDIAPHNIYEDRSNPTCIGFSISIAGQKLMVTGDSSTEEFKIAAIRYGDYLKSDIVQISHHGYGDGNIYHNFYDYVDAPYVINSGLGHSYGTAEKKAVENAEVYILREIYGTCRIPLPYDGGAFESTLTPEE